MKIPAHREPRHGRFSPHAARRNPERAPGLAVALDRVVSAAARAAARRTRLVPRKPRRPRSLRDPIRP